MTPDPDLLALVNAFTDTPFTGNPAGVCLLSDSRPQRWMQNIARELHVSETAFLEYRLDGFGLRWFTPEVEVDLCGHATLASAHVLWEREIVHRDESILFHTRSGILKAFFKENWITLDFPAEPLEEIEHTSDIAYALGVVPVYVGRNRLDFLVEVESEDIVRSIEPDFSLLAELPGRGIILTSHSSRNEYDFVSRFFAPNVGIPEDPVTGSAHCALGPYWAQRINKKEFLAYQASKRGGFVRVSVIGDRVLLGGQAVTLLEGQLLV